MVEKNKIDSNIAIVAIVAIVGMFFMIGTLSNLGKDSRDTEVLYELHELENYVDFSDHLIQEDITQLSNYVGFAVRLTNRKICDRHLNNRERLERRLPNFFQSTYWVTQCAPHYDESGQNHTRSNPKPAPNQAPKPAPLPKTMCNNLLNQRTPETFKNSIFWDRCKQHYPDGLPGSNDQDDNSGNNLDQYSNHSIIYNSTENLQMVRNHCGRAGALRLVELDRDTLVNQRIATRYIVCSNDGTWKWGTVVQGNDARW